MYLLKNAWISIIRNKGRNILMGIIILVVACSCCITLSIRESSTRLVDSYLSKYDIEATISFNRGNLMESFEPGSASQENNIQKFNEIESITKEQIIDYGTSDYVKEFYYTYNLSMNSLSLEKATQEVMNDTISFRRNINSDDIKNGRMGQGDFTILGYSSYESMKDFIDGKYEIVDGKVSENFTENACVMNEELATLNQIAIGDEITLVDPTDENKKYQLVVTGLFKEQEDDSSDRMMSMFSPSINTIITNTTMIETVLSENEELHATVQPTFILNKKEDIDFFKEEVKKKGLDEFYQVSTNLETIELGTESVKNVSTFATTFLILVLIIGGTILFVLNMINVRERKYEIGVLRTIGMKKSLVMIQFVSELFIVAIVSLLLGAGLGSIFSVPVSNRLLENEILSADQDVQEVGDRFGVGGPRDGGMDKNFKFSKMNGVLQLEKVTSIDAVVDLKILVQLLIIGVFLTFISSISATVAISRFSPITILKERS